MASADSVRRANHQAIVVMVGLDGKIDASSSVDRKRAAAHLRTVAEQFDPQEDG